MVQKSRQMAASHVVPYWGLLQAITDDLMTSFAAYTKAETPKIAPFRGQSLSYLIHDYFLGQPESTV